MNQAVSDTASASANLVHSPRVTRHGELAYERSRREMGGAAPTGARTPELGTLVSDGGLATAETSGNTAC
jgi:hypothetical protein